MRSVTTQRILRSRTPASRFLLNQAVIWGILAVTALMVMLAIGGAVAQAQAESQVAAARARILALQHTIEQTTRAIAVAESDDEIERVARQWGYLRPGDQPIVIVNGQAR